jgi:hypothetical protein
MLSANRIAWGAGLLLAVVATLSSVSNATTVSATFSGTVAHEGVSAHSFTIPHDGAVEVTLTGLGPQAVTKVGLGLGTPTVAGNCALVEARDRTHVTGQIAGTLRKGTYCVAVYDSGDVTAEPLDYTISVAEE